MFEVTDFTTAYPNVAPAPTTRTSPSATPAVEKVVAAPVTVKVLKLTAIVLVLATRSLLPQREMFPYL